jgi:hypothetical protein
MGEGEGGGETEDTSTEDEDGIGFGFVGLEWMLGHFGREEGEEWGGGKLGSYSHLILEALRWG